MKEATQKKPRDFMKKVLDTSWIVGGAAKAKETLQTGARAVTGWVKTKTPIRQIIERRKAAEKKNEPL